MENPVVAESNPAQEIKPKTKYTGTVLKTTLAGAVVDIGVGKNAVLHVSQIVTPDDQPIKSVKDALQEGQSVEVWVRKTKDDRIELTMIKPLELEWRDIKKDMVVKGNVVRIEPFGVFLEIGAERPGLIHISELAHGYVRTPADVVQDGEELEAQVIEVNKKKKQIKLSLKTLQPEPVREEPERPAESKKEKPRRLKKTGRRQKGGEFNENLDQLDNMTSSTPSEEAEPTAMEIAMREAMERAKARKIDDKVKKAKALSSEQEDILARTLEQKIDSSR